MADSPLLDKFVIPGEQTGRFSSAQPPLDMPRHERVEMTSTLSPFREFQIGNIETVSPERAQEMVAEFKERFGWVDRISEMKPLGWAGFGRIVWYDEPIYNALVREFGFDPLASDRFE